MSTLLILLTLYVGKSLSVNILYLSAIPSPSHHIWNRALAFALADKGHNVTLIGPDRDRVKPANYSHILIEGMYGEVHDAVDINAMASLTPAQIIDEFVTFCVVGCKAVYKSNGLQTLLNYPPDFKFDLIIVDITVGTCMYPLIHKFKYPPTVAVTAFLLPPYVGFNFGNHLYPGYNPWYGLPYNTDMSFMERVWNFIYMYGETAYRNLIEYEEEYKMAKNVFGGDLPQMEDIERHISLVLTNTDPILDKPQPLAPNFIPVGGLHTRKSREIPKDLLAVLDGAHKGVIVFSLGTNVRSDKIDQKAQRTLLDAFSKIPQTVIWKFESDIDNLPKNVIVRKWLPQNDILGHPNTKLFIGHGGALSTQEAMFHGVPMICVPFFMDQILNTRSVVDRNLGVYLDFRKISVDYVLEKVKEALDNPVYAENMKRTSRLFRDRAETPLERGIFWVEYTLRHGGADFLNTPARDLPFYVSSSLDVVSLLVLIVAATIILFYKLLKMICLSPKSKRLKID